MLLTPEEAAEIMGLSPFTVRRLLRQGELPGRKVGKRQWRIPRADLEEYLGISSAGPVRAPETSVHSGRQATLLKLAKEQGVSPITDIASLVESAWSQDEDPEGMLDIEEFLAPIRLLRESDVAGNRS